MSKLFTGNGFLSKEGEKVLAPVKEALDALLVSKDCHRMSETELHILGAALKNMVGEAISWKQQAKRDMTNKLAAMTDEQFDAYMKAKYGGSWLLVSLTEEELARCPRLTSEEIKASLEEGLKARNEVIGYPRNLLFR